MPDQPRRRRRGEELEAALLDATLDELISVGFARLTMESVAARAKTGVAVLYRRWPRKDDLVIAAMRHFRAAHPITLPDTGSLRGDMIGLLEQVSGDERYMTAAIAAVFAGLLAESGLTPAEVRSQILSDPPERIHAIFRRAHERGEIDLDRLPQDVLSMPFDLLRHDTFMTMAPVSDERIRRIVDDLFLPLATAGRSRAPRSTRRPS